jgi:hypothetical protein
VEEGQDAQNGPGYGRRLDQAAIPLGELEYRVDEARPYWDVKNNQIRWALRTVVEVEGGGVGVGNKKEMRWRNMKKTMKRNW